MKAKQIYSLINSINRQLWGSDAVDVVDASGLISLGDAVLSSSNDTDAFLNVLVDRIGKTVVRNLDLELDFPALFMNEFEFGAVLQKITVNPFSAVANSSWKVGENDFEPTINDVVKPSVTCKLFKDATTWRFRTTIPDDLFMSAFENAGAMGNFINAIMSAMNDSMVMSINDMSRTAINNLVAEKIISGKNVINLVDAYNTAYGLTGDNALDASECMVSKEFARFASTVIRKYMKYLSQPSTLYNNDGTLRVTARDNMHVLMLSDLVALFDAYLISDSFKDVYGLPNYTEVTYWQGNHSASGDNIFSVNSSINITPSSQSAVEVAGNRYTINQSGIVCVLADRQAVGVGINRRRAGAFYNAIDGYENIKSDATIQYFNDLGENAVVFVVADSVVTPAITFDKSSLTFVNSSGADQTITATTMPSDATVTWKTSKSSVATVSGGVVSAAGSGTCTITGEITVGGEKYTATCDVTVGS